MTVPWPTFTQQTLRRVRHTSIAVSEAEEDGLSVRAVDFAPMSLEDNFLVRWYVAENKGREARQVTLSLHVMGAGEWRKLNGHAVQFGDKLAVVSDQGIEGNGDELTLSLGRLRPGERASAALFLIAGRGNEQVAQGVARAEKASRDPMALLEQTRTEWEKWCAQTPLTTDDERTNDLLDSLLCLVRSHVGADAIHTGSLRYPHDRRGCGTATGCSARCSSWVAFRKRRSGLDFFHRAVADSTGWPRRTTRADGRPIPYGYAGWSFRTTLVLMVRDAERYGRICDECRTGTW